MKKYWFSNISEPDPNSISPMQSWNIWLRIFAASIDGVDQQADTFNSKEVGFLRLMDTRVNPDGSMDADKASELRERLHRNDPGLATALDEVAAGFGMVAIEA